LLRYYKKFMSLCIYSGNRAHDERPVSVLSKQSETASVLPPPSPPKYIIAFCTICRSGPWQSGGAVAPFVTDWLPHWCQIDAALCRVSVDCTRFCVASIVYLCFCIQHVDTKIMGI